MVIENNSCDENEYAPLRKKTVKKITPRRLKNIALFYLKRFESSTENLRNVLQRRINTYAKENPQFDKPAAYNWIEDILQDFTRLHYLDDYRFAEIKIRGYLTAGKPERYIKIKLREKGIAENIITEILAVQDYDPLQAALKLAQKKRIGPYRNSDARKEFRQKDMGTLIRAGFDYDTVCEVLKREFIDDDRDDD